MLYIAQQIFEQLELPAKLLDYFVWSHKSNIDQCYLDRWQRHTVEVSLIHHFCPLIDFQSIFQHNNCRVIAFLKVVQERHFKICFT